MHEPLQFPAFQSLWILTLLLLVAFAIYMHLLVCHADSSLSLKAVVAAECTFNDRSGGFPFAAWSMGNLSSNIGVRLVLTLEASANDHWKRTYVSVCSDAQHGREFRILTHSLKG